MAFSGILSWINVIDQSLVCDHVEKLWSLYEVVNEVAALGPDLVTINLL